jgi:hypothetical protein
MISRNFPRHELSWVVVSAVLAFGDRWLEYFDILAFLAKVDIRLPVPAQLCVKSAPLNLGLNVINAGKRFGQALTGPIAAKSI